MADKAKTDQVAVAEKIAQLDAEYAVPPNPDTLNSPSQGAGVPAAEGMHGMFDGRSPHKADTPLPRRTNP